MLLTSTKKFYKVDPVNQTLYHFLDPNDNSLAFYAYAAVQRGVLPIGLVNLYDTEEVLLCYREMGVFVNREVGDIQGCHREVQQLLSLDGPSALTV